MSGHSKWSTIKRKKGAADAKRGKIFSKIIKELTVAAKDGGDPNTNLRLKSVIDKAKQNNMPADNIERAIKRGTGEDENAASFEDIIYEGYGPDGVAILVEALTDNKNRTAADVRHIFTKHGGKLGKSGAVDYLFTKKGFIQVPKVNVDEDTIYEVAVEAGADEVEDAGETWDIYTEWTEMTSVKEAIVGAELRVDNAEIIQQPSINIKLTGKSARQMLKMMDMFEDNEDVQDAWANFDIDEDEMEAFGG